MLNTKRMSLVLMLCLMISTMSGQMVIQTPGSNEINSKLVKDTEYRMKWYMLKDTVKVELAEVWTSLVKKDK